MSESHEAHLSVLTDAEREALEHPGLKQRSKAIVAATELATKIGLSKDAHSVLVERLRSLGKDDAKFAWQTLGDMNELLMMLDIDTRTPDGGNEVTEDLNVGTIPQEGPSEAQDTEAVPDDDESKDWFEGRQFDLHRVSEFYRAIDRKTEGEWVSVPETLDQVNPDEIIGLLALYAANHDKPKVVSRQVDYLRETMLADGEWEGGYGAGVRYKTTGRIADLLDAFGLGNAVVPPVEDERAERITEVVSPEQRLRDVTEALDTLISHEGEEAVYDLARVERLLEQLEREGVDLKITAADFSHDVLKELALIYAQSISLDTVSIKTNIACTWGWLAGVEMEDLRMWRHATKPGAEAADVHNSRASFVNGFIKGWRNGLRPAFLEESLAEEMEPATEEVPLHIVEQLEEGHETDEAADVETRSIDEEPKYVQVVDAYMQQLDLTVNKRAFEELLNPATRGEMTPAKTVVLEVLRQKVGAISPNGEILNELMIKPRGKSALRRMLGLGFMKHGKPEERAPEALKDQLRHMPQSDHVAYAHDLYESLETLLAVLVKTVEEKESDVAPLQVIFGNDGVRLA